jgi:preprotein translocase subunit SecD
LIEHILSQRNATQAQSPKVPTRRQSVEQEKERQQSPHKNEAHQITADFILNKMQVLDFAGQRESPPCKPTRRCSDEHQRYMTQQAIAQVLDEMEDENDWKKDDDDDENYNEEGILEKKSANTGSHIQTGHTSSRAALRRASFRPNFTPEMTDTALAQALVELDDQSESSRDTCPHCVALVPQQSNLL